MNNKNRSIQDLNELRTLFGLEDLNEADDNVQNDKTESVDNYSIGKFKVRIYLDRLKGNKEATRIEGIDMKANDLAELATELKKQCGVGGSSKNDQIILQGNQREKIQKILTNKGYKDVKLAGG